MATLIPVFISALLVARANTQKENTASEERLQKLYKKANLSNQLLDLISCIEKCNKSDRFVDVNTKEKYEDNMNKYSDEKAVEGVKNFGHFSGSTAVFHRKAYNRKRRDQLSIARQAYKGCILACLEEFIKAGGNLSDIQGLAMELITYYSPNFVDLMKTYKNDDESKNKYLNEYRGTGFFNPYKQEKKGGRRRKKTKKKRKSRKRKTKRRKMRRKKRKTKKKRR